jgi:hypothetical protein
MSGIRTIRRTLPDIRAMIADALERKGWSKYHLVQELKGKRADGSDVPQATVYQFLSGANQSIKVSDLGLILDVLGIEMRPPKK